MPFFTRRGRHADDDDDSGQRSNDSSPRAVNPNSAGGGGGGSNSSNSGPSAMASVLVPNRRRVRFDLTLRIIDLNNVPLVSGSSIVKWHLPSSTAAEHRGRTGKCIIREHRVAYDYEKRLTVRLSVGKDGMLQECSVAFEVSQEYSASGHGERIRLGEVKLNLAEYVEASEMQASPGGNGNGDAGPEGVVRRYLMQDSKINSTLKIGIYMRYLEGTRDYIAPPLRTAPVFGGIAGIIASAEPASTAHGVASTDFESAREAGANVPNLSNASRELGEAQDMYRRTLAAYIFSAPGELKADDAIEDIFAGGDGWGRKGRPDTAPDQDSQSAPGSEATTPTMANQQGSISMEKASGIVNRTGRGWRGTKRPVPQPHNHKTKVLSKGKGEIDELEIRDDLKSWNIGEVGLL